MSRSDGFAMALSVLLPAIALLVFAVCMGWRPALAVKPQPGVVILCDNGGVYRSLDVAEGFIATGGPCVLADRHGSRTTAEAITVYDAGKAAP